MAKQEENHKNQNHGTWGTWEELLLASAVKRHGFKNWDSVALEIQTKSSLPHLLTTAENCQQKYHDLNRRFNTNNLHHHHHQPRIEEAPPPDYQEEQKDQQNNINTDNNNFVNIPWLEKLRQLRVAELKQEVQRYDVSILTLQLKVKKLEEEREKSVQEGDSNTEKPDLKRESSENKKEQEPGQPASVSGEESDRENRSVNESNSTGSGGKGGGEDAVGKLEKVDLVMSGSNRKVVEEEEEEEGGGGEGEEESCELGDSVTQLSSESLSSARQKKREGREGKEVSVTGGDETVAVCSGKSEPLVGFLGMIRARKSGSLFESLLESQGMEVYKDVIRQHMDLEAIQTKFEQGSYSSSNLSFFRDLLLLFNNALVFFPKHSAEALTAYELRSLVSNDMRKETQKSDSTVVPENIPSQPKSELERSDSLLAKHKSSIPIIVCRKRSSISAKPSSSSLGQKIEQQQQQQSNENKPVNDLKSPSVEQGLLKMKSEEKPVTGARSTRRGKKNLAKGSSSPSKKQNTSPDTKAAIPHKPETPRTEKKKGEALALEKKKSAVDFLKRIKKNSPAETPKKNSRGASNGGGERKKEGSVGKVEKGKERVLRKSSDKKQGKQESSPSKRNVGRPSKKAAEVSRVSEKRGRDSGGKEAAKRPRKRSRR